MNIGLSEFFFGVIKIFIKRLADTVSSLKLMNQPFVTTSRGHGGDNRAKRHVFAFTLYPQYGGMPGISVYWQKWQ